MALSILCLVLAPGAVRGDVSLSIIEYRVEANRAAFEQDGIILVHVDSPRQFVREEHIGEHEIRTVVSLDPAAGRGYRGGLSTAHVLVTVDGGTVDAVAPLLGDEPITAHWLVAKARR